jgi:tRNA nucleotidyltransferase/poly(A) polymerase/2'-5' RNA ligase
MGKLNDFILILKQKPFIKSLINDLKSDVYVVGGVVRDLILNKPNKDIDLVVGKVPIDKLVAHLQKFGKVDVVGKSFGVIKFIDNEGIDYDIALPRRETKNSEGGYRGFDVQSDENLPIEDELIRRDAKMNAMAININTNKFIDPLGGLEDIKNKQISAANPEAFSDDPLRAIRFCSFASRFGFTIDPDTMKMIQKNAGRVKEIAPERILTEFDKIVKKGNKLLAATLLDETGLLKEIFGRGLYYDFRNTKEPFDKVKTMSEFIYLLSKNLVNDPAEFYKNNLKGDENTYREIKALQIAYDSGEATNLIEARSIAHNMYVISPISLQSQILPNVIKTAAQELFEGKYPKTVNELAVNGNDLMELGLQGKVIGDMQKSLLLKIYSNKIRNNKEELLNLAGQNKPMIKEEVSERIEYGALLLFLDIPIWNKITSIINKEDLYDEEGYGIESDPHVTILYGFHDEVTAEEVFDLYKLNIPLKPIEIRIKGINIFETFKFDVVKFDVESDILKKAHEIMKDLPNTEDFPDYHPHITIACVKKGEGKKYTKPFEKEIILKGNKLIYSTKGQRGDAGEKLMLEGVADRYAEKTFNIPDPNTQNDVQAMGDIQKSVEEPIGYVTPYSSNDSAKEVPIYLNPKSLTNFADNVRVIVNDKGDLYIAQEDGRFNHGMMAKALGLFASDNGIYNDMDEYQLLHRVDNTNAFGLGDTAEDYIERKYENRVYLLNILRQAKRKNPQYDFYNEYYANIKGEPVSLNEFAYPEIRPEEKNTWNINGENVDIKFFVEKYDIWNQGGYADPSEASVLEFLQNNYEDFIHDEKLKKELLVALTDRNVLDETVLNEMSIQTIDYTDIITPEYIKEVEMSDNYERYIEYYQYEENMVHVDKEEIEKTENFKKWFRYELSVRYEDVVDNITNKIKPDGTIDIWRRIKVDDIWVNHLLQAGKHLGIYWSWDERAAEAHWGDTAKNSNALIKSSINEKYIDWKNTIYANMDLSLGEDEKEIRLFKNTSLKIEELNIDGQNVEDIMGSDYELQLRNKTFYA